MIDEEIINKAKETSNGNFYYEQGFAYGYELGEENGRKEIFPSFIKKTEMLETRVSILEEENEQLKEKLETIKELVTDYDMCRHDKDNFINKVMSVINK